MYLLELNNLQLTDYLLLLKEKGCSVVFTNKLRTQVLFVGVLLSLQLVLFFPQNGIELNWLELHGKIYITVYMPIV